MAMMIFAPAGHPAREQMISRGWAPLIDTYCGNQDTGFLVMPARRKDAVDGQFTSTNIPMAQGLKPNRAARRARLRHR